MWQSTDSVAEEIEKQCNQIQGRIIEKIEEYVDSAGD